MFSYSVIDVNSGNHIPILLASPMVLYVVSELIPWWFYEAGKGKRSAMSTYPADPAAAVQQGSGEVDANRMQSRRKQGWRIRTAPRKKEVRTYGVALQI
jgi:hypothetical protein